MLNEFFNLTGKVIVVTGATGVLGEAFVNGLSIAGARVVLIGRNEAAGEKRMQNILAQGGEALFIKADVPIKQDLEHSKDIIIEKWGKIDGLVNAAEGNIPEAVVAPEADVFEIDMDALKRL